MAYVTGFFLVFAGMLIGYFLWYRDRSADEASRVAMNRENEDLRTSLKLAHNSQEKLDERFTRQKGQLNVLQQLCDDWSASREQAERDRAQLEMEVAEKNRRYEEAIEELQKEKQCNIALEDETHKLTQQQIAKLSELEEQWRQRHAEIESSLSQRQDDLKNTSGEKERLAEQLETAEAHIAELQFELETTNKNASGIEQEYVSVESSLKEHSLLLEQTQSEHASAIQAQKMAEDSLATLQDNYEQSQQQVEALRSKLARLDSLESQVASMQEGMDNGAEQLEKVSLQRDKSLEAEKSLMAEANGLQKRIDNQEATIHGLREKLDDALENLQVEMKRRSEIETDFERKSAELENRLKEQTMVVERRTGDLSARSARFKRQQAELHNRIALQTDTIKQLTSQRDALESQLAEANAILAKTSEELELATNRTRDLTTKVEERDALESQLAEANANLAKTSGELEFATNRTRDLTTKVEERDALESQLAEANANLAKTSGELELATNRTRDLATKVEERDALESQLAEANANLAKTSGELELAGNRTRDLTSKVNELKTTCQRISELEQLVQKRDQQDKQINEELKTLRAQYAESVQQQQHLQSELNQASIQSQQMETESNQNGQQLELVRTKLKASEETIRTLRRERAAVLARLANYRTISEPDQTVISFTEAMARRHRESTNYDREYGGTTSQHAVRGTVYTETPESTDDLKLISGIAEVLEARLNDYGIYTFKQIMEWKPEAIEEFSRLLAFKDRIVRDDWISQARYFYAAKQKRSVAA